MKPFLRWAGGKRALAEILAPRILQQIKPGGVYVEPFLGGGAVALAVAGLVAWDAEEIGTAPETQPRFVLGDACAPLINAWSSLALSIASAVMTDLEFLARGLDEGAYYQVRDFYNDMDDVQRLSVRGAALFLYLNATGYNGLYRENQKGGFNVPHGRRKKPVMVTRDDVVELQRIFKKAVFRAGDFEPLVDLASDGDVAFLDPPYDDTFGGYTAEGFNTKDQERLASALRRAVHRGAVIYATNSDTALIRSLYSWANIEEISERRAVAPKGGPGRAPAKCLLITAGERPQSAIATFLTGGDYRTNRSL